MLRKLIHSLRSLIVTPTCPICGRRLQHSEGFICLECNLSAPYTLLWQSRENAMEQRFWGVVPIERAAAFLWFTEGSRYRALIHQFKYHGQWYLAENMGRWFASELKVGDFLEGVELIVPVPLHWRRRIMRGYNQSEHIAHGISRATGIPCCFSAVKRTVHNPPQAGMKYINRWDNINNIFSVPHPERLIGRHILLVDDVFTSGATLLALATQIHRACNGNVKISVATLAASSHLVL